MQRIRSEWAGSGMTVALADVLQPKMENAMNVKDRTDLDTRLRRIAGQITGIQRMVAGERSPIDVVTQVSAARAALSKVSRVLLTVHFEERASEAVNSGSARERRDLVEELVRTLEQLDV